jgi:hypothetical protein
VNVAEGNVAWPANSVDLNPQEQMWAILRENFVLEGCASRDELYARGQMACDETSMDVINRIIDSSSIRLRAVQVLGWECLNGHRNILKEL